MHFPQSLEDITLSAGVCSRVFVLKLSLCYIHVFFYLKDPRFYSTLVFLIECLSFLSDCYKPILLFCTQY